MKGLSWLIEITVMNEDIRVEEETTYLELSKKYKKMLSMCLHSTNFVI